MPRKPMFILLVVSSESEETARTVTGLAEAALGRGHRVAVFFNDESVRLVRARGGYPGLVGLISRGVDVLICRTHAMLSGLPSPRDFARGVEMSSLGALVDLMGEADRTMFVGGGGLW